MLLRLPEHVGAFVRLEMLRWDQQVQVLVGPVMDVALPARSRLCWADLPEHVRTAAESALGAVWRRTLFAGDFLYQSMVPPPANLPMLRAHQRGKGHAASEWLRARLS